MQLYVKYLMYRKLGDFSKTYSIVRLLKDLAKIYGSRELENIINSNIEMLYLLEESYIISRYIPREYDSEIAAKALDLYFEWVFGV